MSIILRLSPEKQSLSPISNCFKNELGKSGFPLRNRVASYGDGCQMVQQVYWEVSIVGIKKTFFRNT